MDEVDIYRRAVEKWGAELQLAVLEEECAELILALARMRRGRASWRDVIAEAADVGIMLGQLRELLGNEDYLRAKEAKLKRLVERIEGAPVEVSPLE